MLGRPRGEPESPRGPGETSAFCSLQLRRLILSSGLGTGLVPVSVLTAFSWEKFPAHGRSRERRVETECCKEAEGGHVNAAEENTSLTREERGLPRRPGSSRRLSSAGLCRPRTPQRPARRALPAPAGAAGAGPSARPPPRAAAAGTKRIPPAFEGLEKRGHPGGRGVGAQGKGEAEAW